ncbi:hypothetical protein SAMN06265222_113133 [Neorhodopirellula lusitana]|uniref:Uncharacterized protein n=1 Tax=Neorhodopirellula lusitana TaxID=445327 RepID=A0ABY1QKT5_9BACT|nr:hypothetical protein [Neorhodopirellula lusitana]SMP70812.1 hypothetical protein SAMN06265222_113133 [Neorhodopirellula lusitana]
MWPLTNGLRCLEGDEAILFRGVVGMMLDQTIIELNSGPIDLDSIDDELSSAMDDQPLAAQMGEMPDWVNLSPGETPSDEHDSNDAGSDDTDILGGHSSDADLGSEGLDEDDLGFEEGFGFETPRWFSMWEPEQRIWLLERVSASVLTARPAPPASAIFEATIEAVYVELADLIAMEITAGSPIQKGTWRATLLDAYVQRCPKDSLLGALQFEATTLDSCLPPAIQKQLRSLAGEVDQEASEPPGNQDWLNWWTSVIERLVDATFGPRLYHDVERLRDGDPREVQRYLRGKGLSAKFLQRIPPLRSPEQTQASIDRLQSILLEK